MLEDIFKNNNIPFGGCTKPCFSSFKYNDPAIIVIIDEISVELTLAFRIPHHLMLQVLQVKCQPELLDYITNNVTGYDRLGLAVIEPKLQRAIFLISSVEKG
jgi:hypothetical protein